MSLDSLDLAARLEEEDPRRALAIYRRLFAANMPVQRNVLVTAIAAAVLGYSLTKNIAEAVHLNHVVVAAMLSGIAFFPPFLLHIWMKPSSPEAEGEGGMGEAVVPALLMFAIVLLTPLVLLLVMAVGVLVLAGPIVLITKVVLNVPFDQIPEVYRGSLAIAAAFVAICYMLSPSRGFGSPFPLKRLFADAFTALFLGYQKIVGIAAGVIADLTLQRTWKGELDDVGWTLCAIAGVLIGILLSRFARDAELALRIRLYMARTAARLGYTCRARYWLSEAADLLDSGSLDDDTALEIQRLADALQLSVRSVM